jgi:hypothetical protein
MLRTIPFLLLTAAALTAEAQDGPSGLVGSVDAGVYSSPSGAFKITVPVLPALGGVISDTKNVVTFHDTFGVHISVAAFPQDATQRWELSTRGMKDYLVYFFTSFVLPDFRRFTPGAHVESAGFSADFLDGSMFAYVLLPGGSMFDSPPVFGPRATPAVAKRGNLLFVRNGFTFVISTELSEKVTEGSQWKKTSDEEDQILRNRLADVIKKMVFIKPAPPK